MATGVRMNWLTTGDCSAAQHFGWLVGSASGVYAIIVVIILIVTAPAYHRDVPRSVGRGVRLTSQVLLMIAPLGLLLLWICGALHAGRMFLACYVTTVSLATLCVVVPVMLLLMLTSANKIGLGSAR